MDVISALRKTTSSIKEWTDENKVQKVSGKGLSTNDYTTADKNKVDNIPNDLIILDGKLYLAQDGVTINDSAVTLPSGGGGGGTTSGSVTLVNKLSSTTITAALGSDVLLKFNYSSSEDEAGFGTAYVYVGDVLKMTTKISPGDNTINISSCVGEGTSVIKLTCMDQYSNSKSLSYTTNIVSLKITSTFDDSQIYNGDINVRYVVYGAVEKDIVFVLDDTVYGTVTTSETGKQSTFTISKQDHGTHTLRMYTTAEIDGVKIKSNELLFDILCVEDNITVPLISSAYDVKSVKQGELISIPFSVYDPSVLETEITLTISCNDEVYFSSVRTIDRTRQTWTVRDYPVGEIAFSISYGVVTKTHIVTVIENDINIEIKNTDLEFQLKAAGKSNSDNNRDIWESGDVTTTFEYVNWESTGWINDSNGDTALRLSGDAKATIKFQPFLNDARSTGRTIEFTFAIRDVNNRQAVAINCFDGSIGFTVTADTAKISSEQTSVSCNYTDEEKISVSYVIEPRNEYRLLSVYLNGVLSGVKQYPENDNFQQSNPLYIEIGSPYCSIDLYSIRSYSMNLTSEEIRDNYIADITDITNKLALAEDNDIYDIYGNLSFDKLQSKIPILIVIGDLPTYKGDKKKVTVSYTDPFNSSFNYEDSATIDVQGTSSQWSKFWLPY